jgi:hypothetical protein
MIRRFWYRSAPPLAAIASVTLVAVLRVSPTGAQNKGAADEFNDSHFHLTNYVQQGIEPRQLLQIMGRRVGRSTLFGIPLQQQWSHANSGDFAPTYYLHTDAPLYYYSFTDAYIASVYRSLSKEEQARFEGILTDPALSHVVFDISWDEVAKYATSPESIKRVAAMFNKHPDRFLFGTDTVAPASAEAYYAVFDLWAPIWRLLTPEASLEIRKGNYERVFDAGRQRVRAWELAHKG